MARRTRMNASRPQRVRISHGWDNSAGGEEHEAEVVPRIGLGVLECREGTPVVERGCGLAQEEGGPQASAPLTKFPRSFECGEGDEGDEERVDRVPVEGAHVHPGDATYEPIAKCGVTGVVWVPACSNSVEEVAKGVGNGTPIGEAEP